MSRSIFLTKFCLLIYINGKLKQFHNDFELMLGNLTIILMTNDFVLPLN